MQFFLKQLKVIDNIEIYKKIILFSNFLSFLILIHEIQFKYIFYKTLQIQRFFFNKYFLNVLNKIA